MSPVKRPSTVTGLRKGIGGPAAAPAAETSSDVRPVSGPPVQAKPARVTLNMPPELYRQLTRWADSAAETIGVPRVGVQESLRAMLRVITSGEAQSCSARVMAELRGELRP